MEKKPPLAIRSKLNPLGQFTILATTFRRNQVYHNLTTQITMPISCQNLEIVDDFLKIFSGLQTNNVRIVVG